jgi:hypothetical protein
MKFWTQVALPIAIVVGLIGGVTFMKQYTGSWSGTDKKSGTLPADSILSDKPLVFPITRVIWDPADPQYAAEFEVGSRGHYDFWFFNRSTSA